MGFLDSEKLLDLLIRQGLIDDTQRRKIVLNKGKQRQKLLRMRRGSHRQQPPERGYPDMVNIVVSMNLEAVNKKEVILNEEVIIRAVAIELEIPFKKLEPLDLDMNIVTKTIPKSFAVNHLILPIGKKDNLLEVATYHPDKQSALDDIERVNQITVRPYLSTRSDIKKILAEFFGFQHSISAAESQFNKDTNKATVDIGNLEQFVRLSSTKDLTSTDQHIKAAVNHLFSYALEQRASDVHIEPKRDICMVRFRIDGILHTIYKLPKTVHSAITSRIKTLARMDIAEKRRPQDGRIKIARQNGGEVEIRVSTVAVAFGEKTVMRLLDPDVIFQNLDGLGFSRRDRMIYNSFTTSPHGIILVTGPTGSGKSTTLYSTLKQIASPGTNIVTVEDPVEMIHEEFNQISVQPQIEVTFSSILRNILRQDPDVIMIGEIRDIETATHAVQAALTGHLVFSTLHTNDAVSTIVRLKDLGLEPFLISSTLLGAMAQRLVRRICENCKEPYEVTGENMREMGLPESGSNKLTLYRGQGCRQCRGTGYAGRLGIFEIFSMSAEMKKHVSGQASDAELRQIAVREGMTNLREDAWQKVIAGQTTVEEILRVTGDL
jgi:general secretion pathway protein E